MSNVSPLFVMLSSVTNTAMAREDLPRYKLTHPKGQPLTCSEMLSLLIYQGTVVSKEQQALQAAQLLLAANGNDLRRIANRTAANLAGYAGINAAAGQRIHTALALAGQLMQADEPPVEQIGCSSDIYNLLKQHMASLDHEQLWVILLNRANRVMLVKQLFVGAVAGVAADPKIILKLVLENLASSFIICHNHPSGNLNPSAADDNLTSKMVSAGKLIDAPLLDHCIITSKSYYSYADEGRLY